MALTTAEQESLRFHLGYGNIGADAAPYTQDTFYEVFSGVVSPNLGTAEETTATTAITASSTTEITPVSMTGIAVNVQLIVDVADDAEIVVVRSVTGSTFTAAFAKAHPSSGYPIAVMCGLARVRYLLWSADKAWTTLQSDTVTKTAGLKAVDDRAIEWFGKGMVLRETFDHYLAIVNSISSLVAVRPAWTSQARGRTSRLEAY